MNIKTVTLVHFSPASGTKTVTNEIAKHFAAEKNELDLLKTPLREELHLGADSLLIVGLPVYVGRLPAVCAEMLARLKGTKTPAIIAAVYGNRDYDDALLEMKNILAAHNFVVVGAGAFIARHSVFTGVAGARPDEGDNFAIARFAQQCATMLDGANAPDNIGDIKVKGNYPYRAIKGIPLAPSAGKACNLCGTCAKICPMGAIAAGEPNKTDKKKCIACTACINVCPQKARAFRGLLYKVAGKQFTKKHVTRLEPETFFAAQR